MNRERALELATKSCIVYLSNLSSWTVDELVKFANIIEDEVKAELLQEQEPVAWRCSQGITSNQQMGEVGWPSIGVSTEPLYTHPAPKEPAGWKLVPIQSTNEMDNAGACYKEVWSDMAGVIYNAMLAAAPEYKP